MPYRGNPALPEDIRQRIENTFEQTKSSAERGQTQEALLGCDFILRLDPKFEPARALAQRLQGGAQDPAEVAKQTLATGAASAVAPPKAPGGREEAVAKLKAHLSKLLANRELKKMVALGEKYRSAVQADAELQALVSKAGSLQEAAPYVDEFLETAQTALASGDGEEAAGALEKIQSLDPEHPRLEELSSQLHLLRQAATAETPELSGDDDLFGELADLDDLLGAEEVAEATPAKLPGEDTNDFSIFDAAEGPSDGVVAEAGDDLFGPEDEAFVGAEDAAAADVVEEIAAELTDPWDETGDPAEHFAGQTEEEIEDGLGVGGNEASESAQPYESGDARIDELMAEGQAAYDQGDPQGAIDAWSRIFLIDLDHEEASRRIEQARTLKDEHERRVEEIHFSGLAALETGDLEAARGAFEEVVAIHPGHVAAQDYLQQLDAGEVPVLPAEHEGAAGPDGFAEADDLGVEIPEDLSQEILVPPDPDAAPPRPAAEDPASAKDPAAARRRFALIGGLVLVLVLAAGAYVYLHFDELFGDVGSQQAQVPAGPRQTLVSKAMAMRALGEEDEAIALLEKIPEKSGLYEEAQELLTKWHAEREPPPLTLETLPAEVAERRLALAAEARVFHEERENLRARDALQEAASILPLDPQEAELQIEVDKELQKIQPEVALFEGDEWGTVLRELWLVREQDPGNADIERMLIDSYYNLGVTDLLQGRTTLAAENFSEAVALDSSDEDSQRHLLFARTYEAREQDLLYRIYVKYLPRR